MGLSMSPVLKSPSTSLASEPQMPARIGRVTTQSGRTRRASSMSCRPKGMPASIVSSSSCGVGRTSPLSGGAPNSSAFTGGPVRRAVVAQGTHADEEAVDVGRLRLDHRLHVGQVVLEAVAGDGIDHGGGDLLGRLLGPVVERSVVVGLVPDLGVDGAGEDELHRDAGPVEVDGHRLAPAREGELGSGVGRLGRDAQAAAQARHVDDRPGSPLEHAGQERQRDGDGREVVDPHRALDLGHGQARDVPAHRDRRVVDDDVEPAVVVPDLPGQVRRGVGVREVGRPARRVR